MGDNGVGFYVDSLSICKQIPITLEMDVVAAMIKVLMGNLVDGFLIPDSPA